ncbi:response regulator transcription factor [Microbacterium maritypicum]
MADSIRVVIVDDHSIFRSGLRADLDASVDVVGEAADVPSTIAVIGETQPDVVLLDVHLPGGSGDDAADVVRVIRAGARGYITKGSSGVEVSSAVRAVADGDAVFSPRLAGFVLDAFGAVAGETATATDELDRLSAREQEVMRLIARGYAYKEVASELFISIKTVETHVSSVLRKLQLSSRHELTAWASERRLL